MSGGCGCGPRTETPPGACLGPGNSLRARFGAEMIENDVSGDSRVESNERTAGNEAVREELGAELGACAAGMPSNAREELGAGGDGPCASASPGYAQLGERVIESCLGGRPGADLGVLAAGGAAKSAPSVEPADKDGCTCAESTPSVAPAGKDGYTCAGGAGEELGVTEDNVDGEPGAESGAFAAGAYG